MTFLFSLSKLKLSNLAPFFAFDLKFNFRTSFFFQPKSSEFSSCFFDFSEFSFFRKTGNGLDLILNKVSISDIFQSPVSWNFLKTTEYIFSKSELYLQILQPGSTLFQPVFQSCFQPIMKEHLRFKFNVRSMGEFNLISKAGDSQ